jgi:carboxymethylenebutenolidase
MIAALKQSYAPGAVTMAGSSSNARNRFVVLMTNLRSVNHKRATRDEVESRYSHHRENHMPAGWVNIAVGSAEMEAYVARPTGDGAYPAIIVAQEIWGINSYIQSIANRLAANGYVSVAPALFHREGPGTLGLFEETDLAFERLGRLRDDQILADLRATADYLVSEAHVAGDRIGIIGFCVGGRIAYLAAAQLTEVNCAVDFYGGRCFVPFGDGPSPFDQTPDIHAPLLGLFGEDDQNPTHDEVEQMAAALDANGKVFEFHSYPGAGHAFNCEERPTYRREAAMHAWGKALEWFERYLKG